MAEKTKQPFYKKKWFIVIVALIIIGSLFNPKNKDKKESDNKQTEQAEEVGKKEETKEAEKKEETPEEKYAITEDMTDEQKIENICKLVGGDQYEKHEIIKNDDGSIGQITLTLYFPAESVLDANHAIKLQNNKAISVLKHLKENNVKYTYYAQSAFTDFEDKYGNTEKSEFMHIYLPIETIKKINFDNFEPENFKDIADEYYIHPSAKN